MAGGPEDHFTDSRELYVLVEGDEWAHVDSLDARPAKPNPNSDSNSDGNSRPRTGHLNRHTRRAETLAAQGIPDLQPRSSSPASLAYDRPDEMPADWELIATPPNIELAVRAEPSPIPAEPHSEAARYGLTDWELLVLRRVAAGRSNGELGAELFISRKIECTGRIGSDRSPLEAQHLTCGGVG